MTTPLEILKGKTFTAVVRWDSLPLVYKAITAITKAGPVSITSTGHGLVTGWPVAVVSAGGMRQINAKNWPLRGSDYTPATKVDANTITLNAVNSADFTTYTSGGSLVYYTQVSLSGFTARMQIRDTAEATGDPLLSLTTENSRITLDDTAKTITLTIAATDTDDLDWTQAVYDLELVSSGGTVYQVLSGVITAVDEVTR